MCTLSAAGIILLLRDQEIVISAATVVFYPLSCFCHRVRIAVSWLFVYERGRRRSRRK